MLMGEHAVLHGSRAMVCAVNRRMHIYATRRDDNLLCIESALGSYREPISAPVASSAFRFVLAAVEQMHWRRGLDLRIDSEFSDTIGFGSSAAVTAGVLSALTLFRMDDGDEELDRLELLQQSAEVIRSVQTRGSASDAAASIFGGVIAYRPTTKVLPLPFRPPISLMYAGYKTPTTEVIAEVAERFSDEAGQAALERIYGQMSQATEACIVAWKAEDRDAIATHFRAYESLMRELGVSDAMTEQLVARLEAQPDMWAAKISGSGLGDCVIGVGASTASDPATSNPNQLGDSLAADSLAAESFAVEIDPNGLQFEWVSQKS